MSPSCSPAELPAQYTGLSSAGGADGAASLFAEGQGSERRRARIIGSAVSSVREAAHKAYWEQEAFCSPLEG